MSQNIHSHRPVIPRKLRFLAEYLEFNFRYFGMRGYCTDLISQKWSNKGKLNSHLEFEYQLGSKPTPDPDFFR